MSLLKSKNLFLVLALAFYLIFSAAQLNKPFIYDEVDFATVKTPMLLQPPVYQLCLQFVAKITNNYEIGFRLFGIIVNLCSAFLIFIISQRFKKGAGYLATILYLLMPVVVQGSMLLDIDNTLLNFMILAFVYMFIRTIPSRFRFAYYFIGFFLLFWTKPTTVYALWFAVTFYDWLSFKSLWNVFCITVFFIFASVLYRYGLFEYSRFSGLDYYGAIMNHDTISLGLLINNIVGVKSLTKVAYYLSSVALWSMPFLYVYIFVAFLKKKSVNEPEKLLILVVVSIMLPYLFIKGTAGGFPKYLFPIFPFICMLAAINFEEGFFKLINAKNMLIVLLMAIGFFVVGDPLKTPFVVKDVTLANPQNIKILAAFFIKTYIVLVLLGVFFYYVFRKEKYSLLLLSIAYALGLSAHQMLADYSVRYAYGERDVQPAIDYFLEHKVDYKQIRTIKHIVYYLSNREAYKDKELVMSVIKPEELTKLLADKNVKYLCFSQDSYLQNPNHEKLENIIQTAGYSLEKEINGNLIMNKN